MSLLLRDLESFGEEGFSAQMTIQAGGSHVYSNFRRY